MARPKLRAPRAAVGLTRTDAASPQFVRCAPTRGRAPAVCPRARDRFPRGSAMGRRRTQPQTLRCHFDACSRRSDPVRQPEASRPLAPTAPDRHASRPECDTSDTKSTTTARRGSCRTAVPRRGCRFDRRRGRRQRSPRQPSRSGDRRTLQFRESASARPADGPTGSREAVGLPCPCYRQGHPVNHLPHRGLTGLVDKSARTRLMRRWPRAPPGSRSTASSPAGEGLLLVRMRVRHG
jgi:hypothetical protein